MLSQEKIASIYEKIYSQADPFIMLRNDEAFKYLLNFSPDSLKSVIVDAGCGNGRYSYNLIKQGYKNIIGFDLLPEIDTKGLFRYQYSSITDIDLPDNYADFLFSASTIYYAPDPSIACREFYRVMKPGSLLVFSAHTKYSLWTLDRKIKRWLGNAEHLNGIKFYSASEYGEMLKSSGFEIVDIDGYYPFYLPMDLSFKLTTKWHKLMTYKPDDVDYFKTQKDYRQVPKYIKQLRSIFGYHLLMAARKPG
jgi:SAM-dependent methyltransferase